MLHESTHPLVKHKIALLRDKNTDKKMFRELVNELSVFMFYEASREMETQETTVETPLMEAPATMLKDKAIAVVPILRAGLGMCDELINFIPTVKIGHLGMARNEETLEPEAYYKKLPTDIAERHVFVVDPMLATGGSLIDAVDCLKKDGVTKITAVTLLSAPEGIAKFHERFSEVELYTAQVDDKLNEKGYILPGLGDAGDRLFGTL